MTEDQYSKACSIKSELRHQLAARDNILQKKFQVSLTGACGSEIKLADPIIDQIGIILLDSVDAKIKELHDQFSNL